MAGTVAGPTGPDHERAAVSSAVGLGRLLLGGGAAGPESRSDELVSLLVGWTSRSELLRGEEARANLAEALALYFDHQDLEIGDAPISAPSDIAA
jgi:hypothetical protein